MVIIALDGLPFASHVLLERGAAMARQQSRLKTAQQELTADKEKTFVKNVLVVNISQNIEHHYNYFVK